ncbi:putative ubiquitin-conjugating enzyme E2 W-B [Lachnellula hyalina]|uniref:Putative ubiquitin-conjugating enzyme E2 W-B n=1 Tax=Lachnellula hyalina TaxID=1316788 RepID=A0A8H8QZY8_9HELO|nr:putative ubiquitin-conjugating enzyme E2 W-B [Lachnellula hyalina]TVY25844.1 putative ubiquitin-conjugating enzyme E2 W-B [Lachnellula hyalina]
MASSLRKRLMQDIAELQSKPYPNITLHVRDGDITTACLILNVEEGYGPMHLTVIFPSNYPLSPPTVQMDSAVKHPNIYGSYICASILNTTEGYTPAYTLKGIAIQLLSFFSSEKIEQSHDRYAVNLNSYRNTQQYILDTCICEKCNFGVAGSRTGNVPTSRSIVHSSGTPGLGVGKWPPPRESTLLKKERAGGEGKVSPAVVQSPAEAPRTKVPSGIQDAQIPEEIILMFCESLETEDLMAFAEAWDRVGAVMTKYDVIRTRELQCFCLKKGYGARDIKLGVGVMITQKGKLGFFESEFDLLSQEGYKVHQIRYSVQGVPFQHWLPLPISYGHWRKVKSDVSISLSTLAVQARLGSVPLVQVIYHFMNDVVVKLNRQASDTPPEPSYRYLDSAKSTLTHASEKAIESYFHLFHLLLCLATSQPEIIRAANKTLTAFIAGHTSKTACPNLGHLLVASLISDVEMTPAVLKSIIKETITRNVVWTLDPTGSNMPDLAYLEPSPISRYRLQRTFAASKTSYRLLMFLNLFRHAAVGTPRLPLLRILEAAFERHGAPPRASARKLADAIKRIHAVDSFPDFLVCMGVERPSEEWFTGFLRRCVEASAEKGYSKMPFYQEQALWLRLKKEPGVKVREGLVAVPVEMAGKSFFPGRGGRGRGRGRGRASSYY